MAGPAAQAAESTPAAAAAPLEAAKEAKEAKEPAAKTQPAEDPIAKGLETIAEQDRALRNERKKWEATVSAREAKLKAAEERAALIQEYEKTKDPGLGAKILGYSDPTEMIRDAAVKLQKKDKPPTVEEKLAAVEKRLAERDKAEEEAANSRKASESAAHIAAVRSEHQKKMAAFIAEKELDYPELAAEEDPGRAISDAIWEHWNETFDAEAQQGEVFSAEQASVILEGKLKKNLAERAKRAEAIRAKKKPEPAPAAQQGPEVKAAAPNPGEGTSPSAKAQASSKEFEKMTYEELLAVDTDPLSEEDRYRVGLAMLTRAKAT